MRFGVNVCVAMAGLGTFVSAAQAQVVYNGHTYSLTSKAEDWNAAESEAVSLGGHLVAINNAAEQTFLNNTFLAPRYPFWIGLNDIGHKGNYSNWVTGEPVTYTNWKSGEPSNSGGIEDYITVNWEYSRSTGPQGTWNDTPLDGSRGYAANTDGPYFGIIEHPNVVPAPSALLTALIGVVPGVMLLRRRRK